VSTGVAFRAAAATTTTTTTEEEREEWDRKRALSPINKEIPDKDNDLVVIPLPRRVRGASFIAPVLVHQNIEKPPLCKLSLSLSPQQAKELSLLS